MDIKSEIVKQRTFGDLINFIVTKNLRINIPPYQRSYAWEEEQILTLINDLKKRINIIF